MASRVSHAYGGCCRIELHMADDRLLGHANGIIASPAWPWVSGSSQSLRPHSILAGF
ncbi:hypothetical protein J6590_026497 [Homalodisca vitripennis]|nr:hypothetical protein J6590_026497 [Homalodisca vitripennis]